MIHLTSVSTPLPGTAQYQACFDAIMLAISGDHLIWE